MRRAAGESWDLSDFTDGERAVYRAWRKSLAEGREPTNEALGRAVGYSKSNVVVYMQMLAACGLVERTRYTFDEPEYADDDPSPILIAARAHQIRAGQRPKRARRRPADCRQLCRAYLAEWRQMQESRA